MRAVVVAILLLGGCGRRSDVWILNEDPSPVELDVTMSDGSSTQHVVIKPAEVVEVVVKVEHDAHANVRGAGIPETSVGYFEKGIYRSACASVRGHRLVARACRDDDD